MNRRPDIPLDLDLELDVLARDLVEYTDGMVTDERLAEMKLALLAALTSSLADPSR